jgi:cytochrome c2
MTATIRTAANRTAAKRVLLLASGLAVLVCSFGPSFAGLRVDAAEGRVRGAKVTFERVVGRGDVGQVHRQRARLLSLAVERGEAPTPFVTPGLFRATYETTIELPARDRRQFRVDGRGKVELRVNGERVLEGLVRNGKSIETDKPVRMKKGDNTLELVFESSALGDGQFRLFWSGVDFGFEPIAPEAMSFDGADAEVQRGEQLRRGMELFGERRCVRCHALERQSPAESQFGELATMGPDLRQVGARVRPQWLLAWLRNPHELRSAVTMPRLPMTLTESADVAAWLAATAAPAATPAWPDGAAENGAKRFRQLGCVACHHAPGEHDDAAPGGRIALDFVAAKWHPAALVDYLEQPSRHYADVRMPDLRLSRDDATTIAAMLTRKAPAAGEPLAGDAARGRTIVEQKACAVCHALDVPEAAPPGKPLRALEAVRGCLAAEPPASAPDHALSAEDRDALRAFLPFAEVAPFRRAPVDYLARHLVVERCTACHALDGEPSTWARVVRHASTKQPVPVDEDPAAQGVPALTWTGAKLQPSWIARFVAGQEPSPRPWLTARMPSFAPHAEAIAAGLVREHGYGPQDEPPAPADAQLAIHGERLVAEGRGFGCVACHALGDQPATQVFEREGVNLLTARGRLRHEYYTRWLADPTRLDLDSRMPKYADPQGKTGFTDVLGGDAAQQFEAIWHFLGSRRPVR